VRQGTRDNYLVSCPPCFLLPSIPTRAFDSDFLCSSPASGTESRHSYTIELRAAEVGSSLDHFEASVERKLGSILRRWRTTPKPCSLISGGVDVGAEEEPGPIGPRVILKYVWRLSGALSSMAPRASSRQGCRDRWSSSPWLLLSPLESGRGRRLR
jgi:hypothetical protein